MARKSGAIALEFTAIVFGVVVALAADSALERRRERAAAMEALRAVQDDLRRDLRQLDHYWEPELALQEDARARLWAFLDGSEPLADSLGFVRDVREVASYATFDANTAAVEALRNSGRLELLADPLLRAAILDYVNEVENVAEFDILHRALFLDLHARLATKIVAGVALPASFEADYLDGPVEPARAAAARALDEAAVRAGDELPTLLAATGRPFMIKANRYRLLRALARDLDAALTAALGG